MIKKQNILLKAMFLCFRVKFHKHFITQMLDTLATTRPLMQLIQREKLFDTKYLTSIQICCMLQLKVFSITCKMWFIVVTSIFNIRCCKMIRIFHSDANNRCLLQNYSILNLAVSSISNIFTLREVSNIFAHLYKAHNIIAI